MTVWRDYPGPHRVPLLYGDAVWSPQLRNHRRILVALPPSYATGDQRYPVLYMQDGQNLFDPRTSFAGHWRLDETLAERAERGTEAIVVGVPHAGRRRIAEYSPFIDAQSGGGRGSRYLAFLTETVKPRIDTAFRTLPGADSTAIAGSSMGGLISLYALFSHRDTFGIAGVLSPALWFADGAIFDYIRSSAAPPGRIYLDVGTGEGARAVGDVRRARDLLIEKGYRPGETLVYVEEPDAGHEESAWARRLCAALPLLTGSGQAPSLHSSPIEGSADVAS